MRPEIWQRLPNYTQPQLETKRDMLKTTIVRIAVVIACLSILSATASADTKVKTRQTSGGQTYENTSYIKGKRQRSETNSGQMIMIQQCDLRRNIQIMPQMKMYMIQPYDEPNQPSPSSTTPATTTPASPVKKGGLVTSTVTTKDTGERKQILGYTARHIITTMEIKSSPDACSQNNTRMEIDGWYIDATFALDCDSSRAYTDYRPKASGGCQDRYETKTIGTAKKGYPVWEKTTMFGPDGAQSFSTINEVVEFSQATLDQSLFEIPEGYREVEDFASAFSAAYANPGTAETGGAATVTSPANKPSAATASTTVPPKRDGVIRFGVAAVKTGNVAEWMNAQNLAAAVQNTLQQNLKGTNVEAILIEATGAAIQAEAQQKQCDYIVFANVSHKKGGGGFGSMISSSVGQVASNVGYGSGTAAVVATNTVVAATVAQNIKNKDELTLDVRLERPTSQTPSFAQTFKGKAKSAGEDIITPLSQQAAQAIIASVGKQ